MKFITFCLRFEAHLALLTNERLLFTVGISDFYLNEGYYHSEFGLCQYLVLWELL